jgi:hypothetical protein
MKTIQDMINEKARKRLETDVCNFLDEFKENKLARFMMEHTYIQIPEPSQSTHKLSGFMHSRTDMGIGKIIFDGLLPQYIEEESVKFYNKVETLFSDAGLSHDGPFDGSES